MADTKAPKETQFFNFGQDFKIATFEDCLYRYGDIIYNDKLKDLSGTADTNTPNQYKSKFFFKPYSNTGKLAISNRFLPVIINYIKKYQYPDITNAQTRKKCIENNIFLAPNRVLLQILVGLQSENKKEAFLTQDEALYFVYLRAVNTDMSKPDIDSIVREILEGRQSKKNYNSMEQIENYWNQPARQYPESVIRILAYTKLISYDEKNTIYLADKLSEELKSYLFEIITYKKLIKEIIPENEYANYMDITEDELNQIMEETMEQNKSYDGETRNRIIFGAPGTGKSHKLDAESSSFLNQEQAEDDIEKIINNDINIASNGARKLNALNALGFTYADYLKNISKSDLAEKYSNVQSIGELYVGSRAKEIAEQLVVDADADDYDEKLTEEIEKAKNGKLMIINLNAIGYKYSDYLCEKTLNQLKTDYNLTSDAQMWWLYRGAQAGQLVEKKERKQNIKFLERVTFHPNYSYSQFVGTYKPMKSKLNQEEITYEYVPGPFMRVYVNAKRNPEKKFLLLIEEINRANVAAVFGDVFQLLDRKNDGTSQYPISASEDQKNYLESCGINEDEIAIPSNMYIWATMNSADQGVLPMDAAFKRRWDFEYLDVDNEAAVNQIKDIEIPISRDGKKTVKWNEFRTQLNDKLSDIGVNEDKLLGPFFMSKKSLDNAMNDPEKFVELFESKVIMYLFEDVVKMQPAKLFTTGTRRYSKLCKEFEDKGMEIFGIDVEVTEVQ